MINLFYRYSDTIIRSAVTVLLLLGLSISSVVGYSLWNSATKDSSNTNTIVLEELPVENLDYIPPDSSLPKTIEDIYTTLSTTNLTPKRINMDLQGDIIVVNRVVNDVKTTFYLEYSKIYDCTIVKVDMRVKDPIQIFYHFEYDTKTDFSKSVFDFLNSHLVASDNKVNLDKNEDGTLKISIE